jgi:hypothetical protein
VKSSAHSCSSEPEDEELEVGLLEEELLEEELLDEEELEEGFEELEDGWTAELEEGCSGELEEGKTELSLEEGMTELDSCSEENSLEELKAGVQADASKQRADKTRDAVRIFIPTRLNQKRALF